MLQIGIITAVATIGYLLDNKSNKNNLININYDQYPLQYVKKYDENENENETKDSFIGLNNIEEINKSSGPLYENNVQKRPIGDFMVNNTVPFAAKFTQDMRGTGVSSSNYDLDSYNLGNDNDTPNNTTLGNFTGQDNTYLHKRETPNMFSPLERRDRSSIPKDDPGNVRPDMDRFKTSILRKPDMSPTEQIRVGPGLNIDPKLPTSGMGFNSGLSTDILPDNVGVYKLNQLEGIISGTKAQASDLPSALPKIPVQKNCKQYVTYEDHPPSPQIVEGKAHQIQSEILFPSATDKRQMSNVEFGSAVKIN